MCKVEGSLISTNYVGPPHGFSGGSNPRLIEFTLPLDSERSIVQFWDWEGLLSHWGHTGNKFILVIKEILKQN